MADEAGIVYRVIIRHVSGFRAGKLEFIFCAPGNACQNQKKRPAYDDLLPHSGNPLLACIMV